MTAPITNPVGHPTDTTLRHTATCAACWFIATARRFLRPEMRLPRGYRGVAS